MQYLTLIPRFVVVSTHFFLNSSSGPGFHQSFDGPEAHLWYAYMNSLALNTTGT